MNAIAEKLHLLETVAPNDALLASMLDKVLGAVADQYRQKLSGYRNKLRKLERQHGEHWIVVKGTAEITCNRLHAGA